MRTNGRLSYTVNFGEIGLKDIRRVGGKNASLGELFKSLKPKGVGVLDGFATTADAYRALLAEGQLEYELRSLVSDFDHEDIEELRQRGHAARVAILDMPLPKELRNAVIIAYEQLCRRLGHEPDLAVRSSATAEDLPEASFAGAAETFLNVRGREALLSAVHQCFASLFTDRAISYRARLGYDHLKVAISVGVQPMVRSDKASSGVIFTLDTESGFRDVVLISSSYGLGEYVVQGVVTPDEWLVFKPTLKTGHRPIVGRRLGSKEVRLVYGDGSRATRSEPTPQPERKRFSLGDDEVLKLARFDVPLDKSLVADLDRTLRPETLQELTAPAVPATHGFYDECIKGEAQVSLGFMRPDRTISFGSPRSFGHLGAGGSCGFADPDAQVGYGYIPNRKSVEMAGDRRDMALRRALYSATPIAQSGQN